MANLVIYGTGSIAEMAFEYFSNDSIYDVRAFTVEEKFISSFEYLGLPVVSFEEVDFLYDPFEYEMFVAVGYYEMNRLRSRIYYEAKEKGFKLASYVSSRAFVWYNVKIGDNCFILENNVLQPYTEIGNDVILWSGNHVGHGVIIHDHVYVASHVVISGNSIIGSHCFIGVNATVADNIVVRDHCLIGAGANIFSNTAEGTVYKAVKTQSMSYEDLSPAAKKMFLEVKE